MSRLTKVYKNHTIYSFSLKRIANLKSKWICLIENLMIKMHKLINQNFKKVDYKMILKVIVKDQNKKMHSLLKLWISLVNLVKPLKIFKSNLKRFKMILLKTFKN